MTTKAHAGDCDWHLDQYDNECSCGAVLHNKLSRLEALASPDAAVVNEDILFGEFCRIMNSKGFLKQLRALIDNRYC